MPLDKKSLEDLRVKYKTDVVAIEVAGVTVGIRKPSRIEYSKFRQYLLDDSKKYLANEVLVADCVVWPEDKIEREVIYDSMPALIDQFASEAAKLAGAGAEVKKL